MREVPLNGQYEIYRQILARLADLPEGYSLDILPQERSLALIREVNEIPYLVLLQGLTKSEWIIFETLLNSRSACCSYTTLLAAWLSTTKDDSQRLIREALNEKTLSELLGPLHSTLYRLKKKLQRFSLTIVAVVESGYLLASDTLTKSNTTRSLT